MSAAPDDLLIQLIDLIDRLRDETADYLDKPGDQQLWYNRGYANGMVLALQALGDAAALGERRPDDPDVLGAQLALPWGKAYRHGEAVGRQETFDVTGNTPS
ncbi:MAG: hypothetical protein KDJ27_02665 [Gammaproteobacteria bacterium]|nr:hypothetical protein [Gammaproteobacteria bacterium]MCB1922643.1 hypothetical protein [Gammaproteobacteria bacterium]